MINLCCSTSIIGGKSFLHDFDSLSMFSTDTKIASSLIDDDHKFDDHLSSRLLYSYLPDGRTGDDLDSDSGLASSSGKFDSVSQRTTNTLAQDLSLATQKNLLKTGTTIVGMCCADGVVLAADTRSTGGPLVMDKAKLKIHQVAPRIYCCAAGTSADCDQLTREARHALQLLRLDIAPSAARSGLIDSNSGSDGGSTKRDLGNEYFDPVPAALLCISRSQSRKRGRSGDAKSSVLIMGGWDGAGPSLHSIEADGVFARVSFSALGSGSTDAIAVLEDFLHQHQHQQRSLDHTHDDGVRDVRAREEDRGHLSDHYCAVTVEQAVAAVRRAVLAGITNDLGSGSFVDFCVIERGGVRRWREDGPCCAPLTGSSTQGPALAPPLSQSSLVDSAHVPVSPQQLLHEAVETGFSPSMRLKLDASFI